MTKALTKDKDERYQTAKDMAIDLRRLRRRLDIDAEIERSAVPLRDGNAAVVTVSPAVVALGIAYVETHNDVSSVWSQPLSGGAPRRITDFETDRIFVFDWSRDASRWLSGAAQLSTMLA